MRGWLLSARYSSFPGYVYNPGEKEVRRPMPKQFRPLTEDDFKRPVRLSSRPRVSEEEMALYREAISQLDGNAGVEIELEEADNPKRVKALTQRAAREAGIPIRFTRQAKGSNLLRFRKQTEAQIQRGKERGEALRARWANAQEAAAEPSESAPTPPPRPRRGRAS